MIPDKSIPTDKFVGCHWLDFHSVSYYKGNNDLVFMPTVEDLLLVKELLNQEENLDISNIDISLVDGSQCALLCWHTDQITGELIVRNH